MLYHRYIYGNWSGCQGSFGEFDINEQKYVELLFLPTAFNKLCLSVSDSRLFEKSKMNNLNEAKVVFLDRFVAIIEYKKGRTGCFCRG